MMFLRATLLAACVSCVAAFGGGPTPTTPTPTKSDIDNASAVLVGSSPWATTAVYKFVDGATDKSTNFITDTTISAGVISSAQYHGGKFLFITMADFKTGALNVDTLVPALNAVTAGTAAPAGFSLGNYELVHNDAGLLTRRITKASFNPTATIDRVVTVATPQEFGYVFTHANGNVYYVEHKPYSAAFNKAYPAAVQAAVDRYFGK